MTCVQYRQRRAGRDTHGEEGNIQNGDVERHAQRNRTDKVHVAPQREPQEALVLRERVHRVEHLNRHEDRQAHRRRMVRHHVREHLAAYLREESGALMEVRLYCQKLESCPNEPSHERQDDMHEGTRTN